MHPEVVLYSSHGRSRAIHDGLIAARALAGPQEPRVLFLPFSEVPRRGDDRGAQEFSWGRTRYFLRDYESHGLQVESFFWSSTLRRQDVSLLFEKVESVPVLVLGTGVTALGMWRLSTLGAHFWGDPSLFGRLLARRQAQGLMTCGTSAGAKQLGQLFETAGASRGPIWDGFGLARDVAVDVHHDWGRRRRLGALARRRRRCLWFGLPNDSALAVSSGRLSRGLFWQRVRFVVDETAESPAEGWHVKTTQGMKIDHYYADGRHWAFGNGDELLMVWQGRARHFRQAWMLSAGRVFDYLSQEQLPLPGLDSVLGLLARR